MLLPWQITPASCQWAHEPSTLVVEQAVNDVSDPMHEIPLDAERTNSLIYTHYNWKHMYLVKKMLSLPINNVPSATNEFSLMGSSD